MTLVNIKQLKNLPKARADAIIVFASGQTNKWSNSATTSIQLPVGTTAQRPATPHAGMLRFNSSINNLEFYDGNVWVAVQSLPTIGSAGTYSRVTVDAYGRVVGGTDYETLIRTSSNSTRIEVIEESATNSGKAIFFINKSKVMEIATSSASTFIDFNYFNPTTSATFKAGTLLADATGIVIQKNTTSLGLKTYLGEERLFYGSPLQQYYFPTSAGQANNVLFTNGTNPARLYWAPLPPSTASQVYGLTRANFGSIAITTTTFLTVPLNVTIEEYDPNNYLDVSPDSIIALVAGTYFIHYTVTIQNTANSVTSSEARITIDNNDIVHSHAFGVHFNINRNTVGCGFYMYMLANSIVRLQVRRYSGTANLNIQPYWCLLTVMKVGD